MSVTVACVCGLKYKVREDNRGKSFQCRQCGARIAVPQAEVTAHDERGDVDEADFESRRHTSAQARGERPAFEDKPGSKRTEGKSNDPRTSRRRKKARGKA